MVDQAEIHRKSLSDKVEDRIEAVDQLRNNFAIFPDKEAAWRDLIRLICNTDISVRIWAPNALGTAFSAVPDKKAAWKDLHRLTGDEDSFVRFWAADALGDSFAAVPDKEAAWKDLHRLTGDEESYVRSRAAYALGAAFSSVPDKESGWKDLHRLTGDEDNYVRRGAANALGAGFSAVPDKEAAWKDLIRLTGDEDSDVRVSANHSLGKASIFKATEAAGEEEFRRELENALQYFEKSAAEASSFNPAKFCLPFYRSFYILTLNKEGSEAEVQKYLAEAKSASEGSKSKEDLLEAVENLSNALKESKSLRKMGFEAAKYDLDAYRRYCDRVTDLLDESEERAPVASRLIKKKLPKVDREITDLIKIIKNKSEDICKTGDTLEAELGCKIQKRAIFAEKTCNPIEVQKKVNQILGDISTWSDSIQDLHLRKYTKGKLEEAKNEDIIGQLTIIQILQVATMSGKNSSPKYVIESSKVQIAEGEGHHQEMEASSRSKIESETDQRPWYKDRNYLIALIVAIITAIGVFIAYIQL